LADGLAPDAPPLSSPRRRGSRTTTFQEKASIVALLSASLAVMGPGLRLCGPGMTEAVIPGRRWRSHRRGREATHTLNAMDPLPGLRPPGMTPGRHGRTCCGHPMSSTAVKHRSPLRSVWDNGFTYSRPTRSDSGNRIVRPRSGSPQAFKRSRRNCSTGPRPKAFSAPRTADHVSA
jgi:hypothetical protein